MTTKLVNPNLPGRVIEVPNDRLVAGYARAGWSVQGAPDDGGTPKPEGTFLVLAARGEQVREWAKEHDVPLTRAIYVSKPERVRGLSVEGLSLIELPGFEERDDAAEIRAAVDELFTTAPTDLPAPAGD